MSDRLTGIAEFVDVVETGSFAAAAQRSGVTRSAIAKIVAKLEQRLGVRLLQRTTRRLNLTDEGNAYFEQCKRALAELHAAEATLETGRHEPAGRLRVTAPVLFGRQCVAPVMQKLVERYPLLDVEMSFSDRVADLVEDGFDLAVRVGTLADHASLVARRLGVQKMGICAAPDYLARHGRPATIDELAEHAGIVYARAGRVATWRVRAPDGEIRECRVASRLRFDDMLAIADAAAAGGGLAWLPCWLMAQYLREGRLALVMDSESVIGAEIYAVWPKSRHTPPKVRAAIDALIEALADALSDGFGK